MGLMLLGPDKALTKSTCPMWCPRGLYGAKPTWVPFGPCNVNPIFPHNPSGAHMVSQSGQRVGPRWVIWD